MGMPRQVGEAGRGVNPDGSLSTTSRVEARRGEDEALVMGGQ